jgi:peptide/nickel transport system substrate-binding protein
VHRLESTARTASEQLDKNFFGRLGRLGRVWRLVAVWLTCALLLGAGLVVELSSLKPYYQKLVPAPGGMYSEGIEGSFTTANPIYAVNSVDTSVSRLLFAGLLSYDTQNHLVGNLADSWTVNDNGTVYTVHLRPHLVWHDNRPLTAADVVFTYKTIQNPDAQSPLFTSWQGVKVVALNDSTVTFTLPNPLSSFPYSLTTGILPKHILGSTAAIELRSAAFNTANPVGAGPFAWGSIGVSGTGKTTEQQIVLVPFKKYWQGTPKLSSFSVHAYADHQAMIAAYRSRAITAMAGLDAVPSSIAADKSSHLYSVPLTAGTYVFFRTTNDILKDANVRRALVLASSPTQIIQSLGYAAMPVNEPLLKGQLGYDPAYAQITDQLDKAKQTLDAAGWIMGTDGVRVKDGHPLAFGLAVTDTPEYTMVASKLQSAWKKLGVNVTVQLQPIDTFQSTLALHSYDALLYGISIGVDPDVFAYWDSSQADVRSASRLNFSEYTSATADAALESGRTRLDGALRVIKYRPFLQAWQKDNPALGLYQPRLLYISHVQVYGIDQTQINMEADRYNNVQNWMIHVSWVTRQ